MVFWKAWYSAVVRGLRRSKLPVVGIKGSPSPHRYPKQTGRSFKLKIWKARGDCPMWSVSGIRAVLLSGFGHLVTKGGPKDISETLLLASIPSFFFGFLLASIVYVGCFTLPELITALTGTVKLRIYSNSVDNYHQVPLRAATGKQLVDDEFYQKNSPTVFFFHGFTETPSSLSVMTVVEALLSVRPQLNVIVVDWSKVAAKEFYPIPALMTSVLGRRVARQIDRWIKTGYLTSSNLRLVGHSLGAQFAGFTAKAITGGRVPILVGLDPAYPGFFFPSTVHLHISQNDAEMVSIIHTDGGVYGIPYNSGWADFYPNGGTRVQPGCPTNTVLLEDNDYCSHWRAWMIFSESIKGGDFIAVHCDSYDDFLSGRCRHNYQTRLNLFQLPNADFKKIPRGSYYFLTNSKVPLAMGLLGCRPPDSAHETEVHKPIIQDVSEDSHRDEGTESDEISEVLNQAFTLT